MYSQLSPESHSSKESTTVESLVIPKQAIDITDIINREKMYGIEAPHCKLFANSEVEQS